VLEVLWSIKMPIADKTNELEHDKYEETIQKLLEVFIYLKQEEFYYENRSL